MNTDSSEDDSINNEFEKRSELLELGKRLDLEEPVFSEEEVSAILKSILTAINAIHDMNFIHRDIKPENVIL